MSIIVILSQTGVVIETMAIDEAYLEMTQVLSAISTTPLDAESLYAAVPIAREIKRKIFSERQLTATIGIATNKLLAKLASDFKKPDGLTLVPERDKVEFLKPLPVRALHGVGRVTEEILQQSGIQTVGDLQT